MSIASHTKQGQRQQHSSTQERHPVPGTWGHFHPILVKASRKWRSHAIDPGTLFFFLEHAGELRIFVLRRENWPITMTNHTS